MTKPLYVITLGSDGLTHAGEPGRPFAVCGVHGRGLLARVKGAFDVTCPRCAERVITDYRLTALTDPTNVQMQTVEAQP